MNEKLEPMAIMLLFQAGDTPGFEVLVCTVSSLLTQVTFVPALTTTV
jgi:hypothetical protein